MKTFIRVFVLVLAGVIQTYGQQNADPCEQKEQKFAAVVTAPVVGTCFLREAESAQQQLVKSGKGLLVSQALQCHSGAHLKIKFCNSKAEKEVTQNAPKWYVVPNVPSLHEPAPGLVPALRYYWYYD